MFKDSAVKKVYPFRFIEESTAIPEMAFPVYIGSGRCVMSLDATGMQGLNNRVQKPYTSTADAGDMYIVKNGMVGDTLSRHNTIPLGFLDYALSVDGDRIDSGNFLQKCGCFRRENDIRAAMVKTSFIAESKLRVEMTAFLPYRSLSPVFRIRFKSWRNDAPADASQRNITMKVNLNLKTRDGKNIFDSLTFDNDKLHALVKGHEEYSLAYGASCSAEYSICFSASILSLLFHYTVGNDWTDFINVMFSFDAKNDITDIPQLIAHHKHAWDTYYNGTASVSTGVPEEEFMYNNSLYLFKLAYEPEKGFPIGHPFFSLVIGRPVPSGTPILSPMPS